MLRNEKGWIGIYEQQQALWIHDGNPKRPHALLTSGKHSNGFFNSQLVIADEALLRDAASDLLELFTQQDGDIDEVKGIVGPQKGATKLSELLSYAVASRTLRKCFWASPAKHESDGKKSMVFSDADLKLLPVTVNLLCEDVLSTGGSVDLTADAVTNAGGGILSFVLALVNRSGLTEVSGKKIVALINKPMPMWEPAECPLCKQGSEAIRPKGENWAVLNASY